MYEYVLHYEHCTRTAWELVSDRDKHHLRAHNSQQFTRSKKERSYPSVKVDSGK